MQEEDSVYVVARAGHTVWLRGRNRAIVNPVDRRRRIKRLWWVDRHVYQTLPLQVLLQVTKKRCSQESRLVTRYKGDTMRSGTKDSGRLCGGRADLTL